MVGSPADVASMEAELSPREVDLLRSAYRVISRQGSHRLSLQDVADESGVSKGLVLYHFKSKDNLLLTTMRWALLRTAARIRERIHGIEDARDTIPALMEAVWIDPERNRAFYLLYLDLIEHAVRVPSFLELFDVTRRIINGLYVEVISQGVEQDVFEVDDVEQAAETMRAFIDGMFLAWLQRSDWETSHAEFCERTRDAVLEALGAT